MENWVNPWLRASTFGAVRRACEVCRKYGVKLLTFIRFRHDPRWGVTDTKVENLARLYKTIKCRHEFIDLGGVVPPMNIQLNRGDLVRGT